MTENTRAEAIDTLTSDERMYRRDEVLIRLEARRLRRRRPVPRQTPHSMAAEMVDLRPGSLDPTGPV